MASDDSELAFITAVAFARSGGEMRRKRLDLRGAHRTRVPPSVASSVKAQDGHDPHPIRPLAATRQMSAANDRNEPLLKRACQLARRYRPIGVALTDMTRFPRSRPEPVLRRQRTVSPRVPRKEKSTLLCAALHPKVARKARRWGRRNVQCCEDSLVRETAESTVRPHSQLMPVPAHLTEFWQAFARRNPTAAREEDFCGAWSFGDTEPLANELATLVLEGRKRGTASAAWCYEAENQRLPQPGDLSIGTDWGGVPLCVIRTATVEVVSFNQVGAEFAAAEGEGDGSLQFWRSAHRDFFTRECDAAGRTFDESMLVVCETFDVV